MLYLARRGSLDDGHRGAGGGRLSVREVSAQPSARAVLVRPLDTGVRLGPGGLLARSERGRVVFGELLEGPAGVADDLGGVT